MFRQKNEKYFEKWSHNMAYILGFIFADGNIVYTKRGTWFWSVQITDLEILEKIKNEINLGHKISNRKSPKHHKALFRLQIGSKKMCDDLIKLGLSERKSKIMQFPVIPKKYISNFIRGYFDGDGGVWVSNPLNNKKSTITTYFTSGSLDFLNKLKVIFKDLGLVGGSLVKKERGYDLKYSVQDSLKIYEIMYNGMGTNIFLKRKKDKFEKYKNLRP